MRRQTMRAIKIDVEKQDIYVVNLPRSGAELSHIYKHLESDVFCIALTIRPGHDLVYVDDEGLLKSFEEIKGVFAIKGQPQLLSGHGLVVGCDEYSGASRDVISTVDQIKKMVTFIDKNEIKPLLR